MTLILFKNHFTGILLVAVLVLILSSCDECSDCEPTVNQPNITATFINQDSLNIVSDIVDSVGMENSFSDSLLSNTNFSINIFTDSLDRLQIGIDSGNVDLEPLVIFVVDQLDSLEEVSEELTIVSDSLSNEIQRLNDIINVINSGSVWVSTITNTLSGGSVQYEDSSTTWLFPVDLNAASVTYEFVIDSEDFGFTMRYDQNVNVNTRREVRYDIENLEIISSTGFNSLELNEKSIIFYF